VNGHDVASDQKAVQLSIICRNIILCIWFVCEKYLAFNADIYKVAKPRIEEVLQMTGLTTESHKKWVNYLKDTVNV
jgi:ABC-2 type transport system ATP-binding protein